jgi:hypothetical protein
VVLAAAGSAGLAVTSTVTSLNPDGTVREVLAHLARKDATAAVELFAALGVAVTAGAPYGCPPQASAEADVPVLGTRLALIVTEGLPPVPAGEPVVAALAAGTDAAHATAGDPAAALQAAHDTRGGVR